MKHEVNIFRLDLIKMQFLLLFRLRQNYFLLMLLLVVNGIGNIGLVSSAGFIGWAVVSGVLGISMFLILLAFGALIQAMFASADSGFTGKTVYQVDENGFYEETLGTETMTRWKGVLALHRCKNYLFVRINGCRVHIIPKREFPDTQQFESFCDEILKYHEGA